MRKAALAVAASVAAGVKAARLGPLCPCRGCRKSLSLLGLLMLS